MDNLEEMNKFLEKYNFPKLNQEEIEDLNKPITSKEIETVISSNEFVLFKSPTPLWPHLPFLTPLVTTILLSISVSLFLFCYIH